MVGMTFQVSDVQVADAKLRRVVIGHGVTAFFYSTAIFALVVNLVAGVIQRARAALSSRAGAFRSESSRHPVLRTKASYFIRRAQC